jgi:hypothetical protein
MIVADRFVKVALVVIAIALVAIAAKPWLEASGVLERLSPAPALAQGAVPKYEITVPKSWGKFIAISNNNLLLEAPDKTWRLVDVDCEPTKCPRIKVLIRWE